MSELCGKKSLEKKPGTTHGKRERVCVAYKKQEGSTLVSSWGGKEDVESQPRETTEEKKRKFR